MLGEAEGCRLRPGPNDDQDEIEVPKVGSASGPNDSGRCQARRSLPKDAPLRSSGGGRGE